jgi:hypothetical protein
VDDVGYIDCNGYPIVKNLSRYLNTTNCSGGWGNLHTNGVFVGVNQNLLKEVGELCSKPDLEKEKLIQDIEELHNTKILD